MEFEDVYELFEAVRTYKLRPKECLITVNSVTGVTIGYATADSAFESIEWTMPLALAKETALARGTKEARYIRELLGSYMGRKQLLDELRRGTLEYGFVRRDGPEAPTTAVSCQSEDPKTQDLPAYHGHDSASGVETVSHAGPRQCYIPGL